MKKMKLNETQRRILAGGMTYIADVLTSIVMKSPSIVACKESMDNCDKNLDDIFASLQKMSTVIDDVFKKSESGVFSPIALTATAELIKLEWGIRCYGKTLPTNPEVDLCEFSSLKTKAGMLARQIRKDIKGFISDEDYCKLMEAIMLATKAFEDFVILGCYEDADTPEMKNKAPDVKCDRGDEQISNPFNDKNVILRKGKLRPCGCCGEPTPFYNKVLERRVCSNECNEKLIKDQQ